MHVTPNLMDQAAEVHYDLAGIKEHAKALSGEFQLASALGKGTAVIVKFPITRRLSFTNPDGDPGSGFWSG